MTRNCQWVNVLRVLCLLFVGGAEAAGQEMPVSPKIQAAIFHKLFLFDRTLQKVGEVEILVVANDLSKEAAGRIAKAFESVDIPAKVIEAAKLPENLKKSSVVYLTGGVVSTHQLCQKNGVLSITGIPRLAEKGEASIGIGIEDYKPQIIVHLGQLSAEGHDLSAQVLQLARLIR